jgi:hypothetical protein
MQATTIVQLAIQAWEEKMLTLLPPTWRTISSARAFSLNKHSLPAGCRCMGQERKEIRREENKGKNVRT